MKTNLKPLPAGPKGDLLSGSADDFKKDSLGFLTNCQKEYGDVVPFRFSVFPALFVNDPELLHDILVTNAPNFSKDAAIKLNHEFFGDGLLSSEGELWKRQRKLSSPAFSPKRLEAYSEVMVEHADGALSKWHDGETVDIHHEMMQLTLGIAVKTLFDAELSDDNRELENALTEAQKHLLVRMNDAFLLILPEWVPLPTNVKLQEAIHIVDKVVYKLIAERRGNTEGRNDLLSMFLSITDENGVGMDEKQIRDEVFTLFFAGHETTALTLAWTFYLLATNPQVEEKLLAELKQVLNGRLPAMSDYMKLQYTEKVIKESMRIRPPVWAIARETLIDCAIGEYAVKKGTAVIMSQWVMHHDQRYYKDPQLFNPDRWAPEFIESLPKFAYFPFGGGPRTCIGNGFAMIEAVLVLACIMQNYHMELVPNHPVKLNPAVTLRPAHGIKVILHKRN